MINKNQGNQMEKLYKKNIEDILALTPMQEGMLFHYLKDPESDHYFEQISLEISGKIDVELFEKAWNIVIEANEMLRVVFCWEKVKNPIQIILKKHKLHPVYHDISDKEPALKKTLLEALKVKDRAVKFDLREVPFRVTLCKIAAARYEMIISNHHILFDGWSIGIILKEFFQAYNCLFRRNPLLELPVKTKFKQFVQWIQQQDTHKQEEFWKNYLNGFNRNTAIPLKRRKRKEIKNPGYYQLKLPGELKNELENFVKIHNITIASFLYSVWGILLQRYNSCNDVLFDTTVSGRSAKIEGIENMVGLFINTLPLRVQTLHHGKISVFLSQIHHTQQQREEYANSSFMSINEYLDECRVESLFDSLVVIENYPLNIQQMLTREKNNSATKLTLDSFAYSGRTLYDLTVIITLFNDITLDFTYNNRLFDEKMMIKLGDDILDILWQMVENSREKVFELTLSTGEVKERIFEKYNRLALADQEGNQTVAPGDTVEKKLLDIWSELFHMDKATIGIDTNFFDFGGHSLKAKLLSLRIYKEMNIRVPLTEIFNRPTIRELSRYLKNVGEGDHWSWSVRPVEEADCYELSSTQKRFFLIQQMESRGTIYNISVVLSVRGLLDKSRFEAALYSVIERHESLRTSIRLVKGQPLQQVHREIDFGVEYYDLGNRPVAGDGLSLDEEKILNRFIRSFDLSKPPLLRTALVKLQEDRHTLLVDIHHIIFDGMSMSIFINDLMAFYHGKKPAHLTVQYKDFSEWQTSMLKNDGLSRQEKYWLKQLEGDIPLLNFPTDFPRGAVQSFEGDRIQLELEKEICLKTAELAKKTGTTLFMILLAVYNTLLFRYTGQQDIIIGSPIMGREHANLEKVIGPFAETLVLRNYPRANQAWAAWLKEVKRNTLAAFENSGYPFRELVKKVSRKMNLSRNPLFDAMLSLQNQESLNLQIGGLTFKPHAFNMKISKVDFTLEVYETPGGILFILEYSTALFKRITMEKMLLHFVNILKEVVNNPGLYLSEIDMTGEKSDVTVGKNEVEGRIDRMVDCLLIGHNEMDFEEYEKTIRKIGVHSGAYRDLAMNFIYHHQRPHSLSEIFNTLNFEGSDGSEARGIAKRPLGIGDNFSGTIAYLGSFLQRRGLNFDYINSFQQEKAQLAEKLTADRILTVAITTTLYVTIIPILEIVELVRTLNHTAKIIIGGPFISSQVRTQDANVLNFLLETLDADFYVNSSRGEQALVEIIYSLKKNSDYRKINNIYYKSGNGYTATTAKREDNKLSENMVNWGLFAGSEEEIFTVRTSISCPFSCAFCGFPQHAGKYEQADIEAIEQELRLLKELKSVKYVNFIDDTFNLPRHRFKEILKMMMKNRFEWQWFSYFRCQYADREILELMKESGCAGVFLGLESGSNRILKNMNKAVTVEKYLRGIEWLKRFDIMTFGCFIAGFPGETAETVSETAAFIKKSGIDFFRAQLWYCDPITPIWQEKEKYHIEGAHFNWSHATMDYREACDLIEKELFSIDSSTWTPQYNFEFNGLFQLMIRGMSINDIKEFLKAFKEGVKEKLAHPSQRQVSPEILFKLKQSFDQGNDSFCFSEQQGKNKGKLEADFDFLQ